MANVGVAVTSAFGGKWSLHDFIPTFADEEQLDPEAMKREEELQAKLRAADQRALLAALSASVTRK